MPTHFTQAEREALYRLKFQEGYSLRRIAQFLSKSHSSLSRELHRNQNNYLGYLPDRAQALAKARRKKRVLLWWEKDPDLVVELPEKLLDGWSPELISVTRARAGLFTVSHESIYAFLYSSRARAMGWHRLLTPSHTRRKNRTAAKLIEHSFQTGWVLRLGLRRLRSDTKLAIGKQIRYCSLNKRWGLVLPWSERVATSY